jgi:aspartokinase
MMETDMTTTDLKEKLAATADKAKETAAAAMHLAGDAGRTVKAEAKARAADTMETVRNAAGERADAARDTLVSAGERLAETLQSEAGATEGMSSRVLNGLAGGVTTATDGLRGRTLGELFTGAQDYARRHPGTFAVGAAVAGFALARFLRSSSGWQSAEARAADATDRIYRDAARRTVDTLGQRPGQHTDTGPRA